MGTVKNGPYGWYYSYTTPKGQERFQNIPKDDYDMFYAHGYLNDSLLEAIVEQNKTVVFKMPRKDGSGDVEVTAKLVPHISKSGKKCKRIDFSYELNSNDMTTIINNLEKIGTSYYVEATEGFDYTRPQKVVDSLNLDRKWKTYATQTHVPFRTINKYCTIDVYIPKSSKDKVTAYLVIENKVPRVVEEAEFRAKLREEEARENEAKAKVNQAREEAAVVRQQVQLWLVQIGNCITNKSKSDIVNILSQITSDISEEKVRSRVISYLMCKGNVNLNPLEVINEAMKNLPYSISYTNYDENAQQAVKTKVLTDLKIIADYYKNIYYRDSLLKRYEQEGLASLTDSVDVNTALSLGYFTQVQTILVKYKTKAPEYIITKMYPDEIDLKSLEEKLLNLLKVYYDFYDFPEKDRKAIAKFIAVNKMSEYYESISKFEDVVEVLIDNSRDPKLTKPILESIAGTSKADVLKNKTYYFEKRGRLRNNILVNRPIELLDGLRDCIKYFNTSSGVAILTNIELDADESFIFQFYTFANNEGDESGFDGRRMLNLTRIYNRSHSPKIGFVFDNEEDTDDESDE